MESFYDVLQYLKKFNIYIHFGNRVWDLEFAANELTELYKAGLIPKEELLQAKSIIKHELTMPDVINKIKGTD